jgi:hypothetical protein
MNDDNAVLSGIICIAVLATSAVVVFLIGVRFGFDDGVVDGKNQGIVFCMEKQKECKTTYDYLKLQEKLK